MEIVRSCAASLCCLPVRHDGKLLSPVPQRKIKINGVQYKLLRLLGEGGFSYVYLCSSPDAKLFALKVIRCSLGEESFLSAMKEVNLYDLFRHPSIIRCEDYITVQSVEGKVVYILLPYYKQGNLQDLINRLSVIF